MENVNSVNEMTDILPNAGIYISSWQKLYQWLPWLMALSVVLVLILAFYLWYKKRKPKQIPVKSLTVKEILTKITQLNPQQLSSELFYQQITYYLKHYLWQRFHIPALDFTSQELLKYVQDHKVGDDLFAKQLAELTGHADLAKFANQDFEIDLMNTDKKNCTAFIVSTKAEKE